MIYDIVIVGGGPSGLTAALYALRAGKKVVLIERYMPGGQVAQTKEIKNYPGYESVEGINLATDMFMQVSSYNLEMITADAISYDLKGEIKKIVTTSGTIEGLTVILCLGASSKQINLANEKQFLGKGISYCATCDGNFYKDKTVAVLGSSENAIEEANYLADIAKKVYLISLMGLEQNQLKALSKNIVFKNAKISKLIGDERLKKIELLEMRGENQEVEVDGLFITLGKMPATQTLKNILNVDENGYIITSENMETSLSGVYAAGDVRKKTLRQIVTACSDGAIAATNAIIYIQNRR